MNRYVWLATAVLGLGIVIGTGGPEALRANSIYSRNGIGLNPYTTSMQAVGMGGAGIASLSGATLHYLNPASLSVFKITRFDGSAVLENTQIRIAGKQGRFANTNFNSFQVAIPVKEGYGIGLGLIPYSQTAYELAGEISTERFLAVQTLKGKGTLSRAFLAFGGSLGGRLVFGAALDVYVGRIERTWRLNFQTAGYENTRDMISTYLRGAGGRFGAVFQVSRLINVGAVVFLPAALKYTTNVSFVFGESRDIEEGTVRLPLGHGYGVTLYPSEKWHIAADVFLQSWGDIQPEEMFGARTVNTMAVAFGVEYTPSPNQAEGIFRRMSYRVGARIGKLPYTDERGEEVQEQVVTAGFTLPYYFYRSKIDVGVEYGRRGSLARNVAEETILRVVIGVTSGEKWFSR